MKYGTAVIPFCAFFLIAGCESGKGTDSQPEVDVLMSSLARSAPTNVPPADLAALVAGNNAFALNFYRHAAAPGSNVFYSPYSISLALAMTWVGAKGETDIQIAQAMHFTLTREKLYPAFNLLDQTLESRGTSTDESDAGSLKLHIANALWGQKGYPFASEFLDVLAEYYGAGMNVLDFRTNADGCRTTINQWISAKTENRINDLLPAGSVTAGTRLVLTNAIYFKGCWLDSFHRIDTRDTAFHLLDGSMVTSPLMFQHHRFNYTEGSDYQAVELPYHGNKVSMVVLLPASGDFGTFEARLSQALLDSISTDLTSRMVNMYLPKFGYTSGSISLRQVLSGLGLPVAFSSQADFTGMAATNELSIGDVIHKAFVTVDEYGTEAAAATGVVMVGTSIDTSPPIEFRIDRPFIFIIRDIETNAVLFIGRIVNPLASG